MGDTVTVELTDDQARELVILLANIESELSTRGQWADESVVRTIRKQVSASLKQQ